MTVTKFYRLSQKAQAARFRMQGSSDGTVWYEREGEGGWVAMPYEVAEWLFDEVEMDIEFTAEELSAEREGHGSFVRKTIGEALENGTYL